MAKIRVALLGCGTFARDAYIGMLKRAEDVELAVVWSRSKDGAQSFLSLVAEWAPEAVALSGEEGMCELLGRDDIRAVLLVLPVQVMLEVARRALAAGKHVLQEKPVGTTVAEARLQLSEHRSAGGGAVWCLAENYRFEDVFLEACRQVHSLGEVVKIDFIADMPMNSRNKYFGSEWRRDTETCPGGFLMDSSVHFIAALRLVASAAGAGEPVAASALLRSCTDSLPPPDSLAGMLQFANGCMATVSFSFSCSQVRFSLSVVGTHGSLEVMRGGWSGSRGMYQLKVQREGEAQPTSIDCPFSGIDAEFRAFLRRVHAAEAGQQIPPDDEELLRTDPLQGLRDLAVIEALLKSGASGGQQTPVEQVDV